MSQESGFTHYNTRDASPQTSRHKLDSFVTVLRDMRTDILAFNEIFANLEELDRAQINTPMTLVNAWIHVTLALATFTTDARRSLELAERARSEINMGMKEIISARSEPLRLQNLAVLPFDLVALLSMKLTKDITPSLPDIYTTYSSYASVLVSGSHVQFRVCILTSSPQESDIDTKPPDRRIEQKLGHLKQELSIIEWIVDIQRANLRTMLKVRQAQSGEDKATEGYRQHQPRHAFDDRAPRHDTMASMAESILESDEPCGFSHLLLHQCLEHLALRKSGVKQMGMSAAYLITAVCPPFTYCLLSTTKPKHTSHLRSLTPLS